MKIRSLANDEHFTDCHYLRTRERARSCKMLSFIFGIMYRTGIEICNRYDDDDEVSIFNTRFDISETETRSRIRWKCEIRKRFLTISVDLQDLSVLYTSGTEDTNHTWSEFRREECMHGIMRYTYLRNEICV